LLPIASLHWLLLAAPFVCCALSVHRNFFCFRSAPLRRWARLRYAISVVPCQQFGGFYPF
jgi:hypothetical protein